MQESSLTNFKSLLPKGFAVGLAATAILMSLSAKGTTRDSLNRGGVAHTLAAADPPSYLPWYTSPAPTIAAAYVSIAGAWGAGNLYNTYNTSYAPVGTGVLATSQCSFICFGTPGMPSHHYLAFGNDINPPTMATPGASFTHDGAANDCNEFGSNLCPGGVTNNAFGVTVAVSPLPTAGSAFYLALDTNGNLGLLTQLRAGSAIVAGAGEGTPNPIPSPSNGSLVSYTGTGSGEILLGSSGSSARCDYGETSSNKLTCNAPLRSTRSTASSPGAVPPCYDHDGSSCSATFHVVKNSSALNITTNGSCANDTWCSLNNASISFTGTTAQFANDRYNCTISSMASYLIGPLANSETTTGFQIHAYNNSGRSIASGSDLGLTYVCFGI
ncbi:MAG: hypothetical protein WBW87_08990 [Candidatus Cybelea sp.]